MSKKRIILLGATGYIGSNTLAVIRSFSDKFSVIAMSAHTNEKKLLLLAEEYQVSRLALSGGTPESGRIGFSGGEGLLRLIRETEADMVVNGISGSSGLLSSIASIESGKHLALANKETVVLAGRIIKKKAQENGRLIFPIDSEHAAIFQLLTHIKKKELSEITLTASGGGLFDIPVEDLRYVTPEQALRHPVWKMGLKITVDSATMANKGLEIIEAKELFDIPLSKIRVLVHPECFIHSFIKTMDGSMYAQISEPDLRMPIQNALTYPDIFPTDFNHLDLTDKTFTFHEADPVRYPMLKTACEAAAAGGSAPIVYNAANEIAVQAFLRGLIPFTSIPLLVRQTLEKNIETPSESIDEIMAINGRARAAAEACLESGAFGF